MVKTDYIIIGLGIAGLSFCEQLESHQKRFRVFDTGLNNATAASGGVFNPVVLKRFTMAWMANEHIAGSLLFYKNLSKKLNEPILSDSTILRILASAEEQNNWVVASDKKELAPYLSSEILKNTNENIIAPFGYGKVNNTGRISPSVLLDGYKEFIRRENILNDEAFDYNQLIEENGRFDYKGVSAKRIVFAEGAAVVNNPYFPKEHIIPNKGEFLIIKAPKLRLDLLVKGPVYIIPLGGDLYKVGATYSRDDKTYEITDNAKNEIILKLRKMISCDFEIISQEAGMRPTTKDRRPLLGALPPHPNMFFLNGLGTHGIMGAPFLSKILYDHIENGVELPEEMNINRWL